MRLISLAFYPDPEKFLTEESRLQHARICMIPLLRQFTEIKHPIDETKWEFHVGAINFVTDEFMRYAEAYFHCHLYPELGVKAELICPINPLPENQTQKGEPCPSTPLQPSDPTTNPIEKPTSNS